MRDERLLLPALIDGAKKALESARTFGEVKAIRDRAEGLRRLAQSCGAALDAQNFCAELKLRAERRMGEELHTLELTAGRPKSSHDASIFQPTLEQLGVDKDQSSRWQKIFSIPERTFEHIITDAKDAGDELTTASVLRLAFRQAHPEVHEPTPAVRKNTMPDGDAYDDDDVGLNRIKFGRPIVSDGARAEISEILRRSRTLTNGGKVAEFEERFVEAIGGGRAVAVSSCTAALHLALLACKIGPGDEVIVPAQTFVASAHVVEAVGARPVFCDVWPDSGVMDPEKAACVITPNTRAIMPVHYAGRPCYMGTLMDIARRHNLRVIEDAATALGATHSNKHVGLIGDIGCFSFHPVKHITTMEGGMLVSRDFELAEIARRMREFGKTAKDPYNDLPGEYDVTGFGMNYRMTEIQGALGVHQLADAPRRLLVRKSNYRLLKAALKDFEMLDLGGEESAAYCMVVILPDGIDRRLFREDMARWNVESSIYYPGPVPLLAYYREKYHYKPGDFPNAERIAERSIALPVGPHLGATQMAQIAQAFHVCIAKQEKVAS